MQQILLCFYIDKNNIYTKDITLFTQATYFHMVIYYLWIEINNKKNVNMWFSVYAGKSVSSALFPTPD